MAIYTYTPSGGVIAHCCCVPVTFYKQYILPFAPGDAVFVKEQAQRGILEKVVIKNYTLKPDILSVLYKDTLNRLWFDYELISSADAIALAEAFYDHLAYHNANAPCP
jgi:hypothetical protein